MTPELDTKLCLDYPKIFVNRAGSPWETLMCFGFEHGDGWYDLIDQMCGVIQSHIDWQNRKEEKVKQVVAVQVKEKFGGLRFYYDGGDDFIRGVVAFAEDMSCVICEECGKPGKRRSGGWIRTLCDEHAAEREVYVNNF